VVPIGPSNESAVWHVRIARVLVSFLIHERYFPNKSHGRSIRAEMVAVIWDLCTGEAMEAEQGKNYKDQTWRH